MGLKKYKLGEILDVTRGASLSGKFYATEGEYIRLTCGNFDYQNNCFKENKSKDNLYYTGDFRSEFLMEKGDIITPLTEQAIGLLGSTAIIPESGKYIQSQDVAKIICKEDLLDKDFAFYLIPSTLVKQQLSAAAQQTKIRHTSPDKIKDCTVWIPELAEQKRISKLLRSLDCKIELNRAINQNLSTLDHSSEVGEVRCLVRISMFSSLLPIMSNKGFTLLSNCCNVFSFGSTKITSSKV